MTGEIIYLIGLRLNTHLAFKDHIRHSSFRYSLSMITDEIADEWNVKIKNKRQLWYRTTLSTFVVFLMNNSPKIIIKSTYQNFPRYKLLRKFRSNIERTIYQTVGYYRVFCEKALKVFRCHISRWDFLFRNFIFVLTSMRWKCYEGFNCIMYSLQYKINQIHVT